MVQPIDYVHKSGNSGLSVVNYFNYLEGAGAQGSNPLANTLLAQPLFTGDESLLLDGLGLGIITGSTTTAARLAIYDVESTRNLYPRNLLYDLGSVTYSSPNASASISLPAGKMFWIATNANGTNGIHRAVTSSYFVGPMGIDAAGIRAAVGLSLSYAYTLGMPTTFPAGATPRAHTSGTTTINRPFPAIVLIPS